MKHKHTESAAEEIPFLDGKLLVAMPGMGDPRFDKAVIFMCAHSPEGAMGLIINKPADDLAFKDLMTQLDISWDDKLTGPKVHLGGPVEHIRGFVLHPASYHVEDSTMTIGDDFGMTATQEILKDIASGQGPDQAILALGYTGWGPGQLENELRQNTWLICDAPTELVFSDNDGSKWDKAVGSLGFDPRLLSADGGRA
ncbi:MAG: YqgE/AlgH family protein [Rhodobacteraceae bacterium]|nr:YqgE/AlgH family protein [Paracoccaceae bacterium]